ncbi:helix-turn-helix domain-containing protein [Alienimonas chondri]|uniref:Helix-turn-helix domain-containing protein n=1 Tax=Alienimonas chondri TaxID=2681879 RepID=A0ABX1V958_9PLAN|nr:helix-turn-helix domain-containing protein [Alienimonas chondri]NNJ24639.1 hypothetical protein [Alienimonas chondri]
MPPNSLVPASLRDPAAPSGDILKALDSSFTPAHVADRMNVHIATVYRWMDRGVNGVKLAFLRAGGRQRRVPRADLAAFIVETTRQARSASPEPPRPERRPHAAADAAGGELAGAGW